MGKELDESRTALWFSARERGEPRDNEETGACSFGVPSRRLVLSRAKRNRRARRISALSSSETLPMVMRRRCAQSDLEFRLFCVSRSKIVERASCEGAMKVIPASEDQQRRFLLTIVGQGDDRVSREGLQLWETRSSEIFTYISQEGKISTTLTKQTTRWQPIKHRVEEEKGKEEERTTVGGPPALPDGSQPRTNS